MPGTYNMFVFDIGPLISVAEFIDYNLITIERNIGLSGEARGFESGTAHIAINDNIDNVDWYTPTQTQADPEGSWYDMCGIQLKRYEPNTGRYVYTGYDLVWQKHLYSVALRDSKPVEYIYDLRIIIRTELGALVQTLGSTRHNLGWDGSATSFLQMGYSAIEYEYNDKHYIGVGMAANWYYSSEPTHKQISFCLPSISLEWLESQGYIAEITITDDPNLKDPDGPSKPGGGDGNHNRKTEAVTLPDLPDLGALDAGMITLYRLTGPEMTSFTSELWSFWTAIKAFFADPLDFVIGAMILPFTPSSIRKAKPKFGADVWNTAFDVISEQFYSISCGTIDIEKYYGSCFDYDPYHKLQIYIPYVGYRDLPVDQIMGKTIELTYHIDCMTGDFVAFVHTPVVGAYGPQLAQIICQFAGTMGVHVPLTRQSFDEVVKAGINLLGGAVGMAAGGIAQSAGLEGGDLNANQIASQASGATVSAINSMKSRVIRSGSIGASSGMLAKQNPFIISELPRQSLPENYKDLEGYPSNIYGTVGSFSGYLAVETVKLNVTATSAEKEMIMQMLKGGVFV